MAKISTTYVCTECGFETPKWMGKCPGCGSWNTLDELKTDSHKKNKVIEKRKIKTSKLSDISSVDRFTSNVSEFDRVLGGGAVSGEVVVLGGMPGVGKSTLLLSVANGFAEVGKRVLYFSAEESLEQVFRRAKRVLSDAKFKSCSDQISFVNSIDADDAESLIASGNYDVVIVDSIQAISTQDISSVAGSVSQVRECAYRLTRAAKMNGTFVIMVGHITKGGMLAGPMVLSHVVDAVFMLENENLGDFRILRSIKNRFGSVDEAGVFQMLSTGMKSVENISTLLFDSEGTAPAIGVSKGVILQGIRPMMIEIQALVLKSGYSIPKRVSNGIKLNRLQMLVAVLSKSLKLNLDEYDIFINISGGFKSDDTSLDLPICSAIISSLKESPIDPMSVYIGEVGLTGSVRRVVKDELRRKECIRLGYKNIYPDFNNKKTKKQILLKEIFS